MKRLVSKLWRITPRGVLMSCAVAVVGLGLSACSEPAPRTFALFMEDRIAREGTLARCDGLSSQDTQIDIECANARRAEATVALRLERERLQALERESERRIEELSRRISERERLAREAALEAVRAEREAYDALWRERINGGNAGAATPPEVDGDAFAPVDDQSGELRAAGDD